jgi:myo-inositol catabolism protein IolC
MNLYMLAFDHRASFSRDLLGIEGEPTPAEAARVADAKRVIYEAFEAAVGDGVDERSAGLLVDEQFGAEVARRARDAGFTLAMPVEKSGQDEFDFEFGGDFGRHIEEFDPTFAKVLVRYNPEGDTELNRRQAVRLRTLSDWLHERGRKLLFELLVPPGTHQLERVGGAKERYDAELRPELVVETMRELQNAGVEPDIWKIEGFERREDCVHAAAQARAGGRDGVT